ncbi:MAG TPA: hypothetical protein VNO51_04150 [Ilumatobacteraceae bacterium]|nr:hypothetical protein [Ilumatobacteraceae bacterium]
MHRVIHLAGRSIELSAADEWRWEAVDALFAGCADSSQTPHLRLRFDQVPPTVPARPPTLSYTGIDVWLGGDGAACRSAAGVAAVRQGDDIVVGGPMDDWRASGSAIDPHLDLQSAFRRSVQHVLADALAEHGRHTLHAASIRYRDHVVVALGGTGAGKSTLAYAASRRGGTVLSDDLTFLAGDDSHLVAWGLPKPLNLPGDLVGEDHSASEVIPQDARNRVRVPLERSLLEDPGHAAVLLLVAHAPAAGYVQRIEPGPSLLKTVLPSFPLAPDPDRMRELFPIAAALSRLPTWALFHDADPARRLDVGGTLLEQITGALAHTSADRT